MPDAARLIEADFTHAGLLAAIHREAFSEPDSWSENVMRLQLELPTTFGFIHPTDGMILARVAADDAEILTIAVTPARQRMGTGAILLRATIDHARRAGAVSMFLEVAVTNAPARALYAAMGFQVAGSRRRYYSDGTDALVLRAAI